MKSVEERFSAIEKRLAQLEQQASLKPATTATERTHTTTAKPSPLEWTSKKTAQRNWPPSKSEPRDISITQILGWTGATALVLAAAYLIRLALDEGWLTPARQLALAVLSGFTLIATGLWLRSRDRQYASLLPAGGLVVLFLSIYGAHLYYHFIPAQMAMTAVIITCIGSLWLSRQFESELYALFAVVGSYSAPFMLQTLSGSVADLAIYYSAWSLLFCLYSLWIKNRHTYLLAAYMALLGFHFIWSNMAPTEWGAALSFQVVQFVIFLGGAVYFSIRHNSPMSRDEAIVHLPLLLIFYVLQYSLLERHLPDIAPWLSLGSAALLLLIYRITKKIMALPLVAGELIVGTYVSLALFHAGYIELLPHNAEPWAGLLIVAAMGLYLHLRNGDAVLIWPVRAVVGVIFAINYLRVITNLDLNSVPAHQLLALLYAAQLYIAYYLTRQMPNLANLTTPLLYAGHVALLAAAVDIFDERLAVSLAWGVIALACLAISFKYSDKLLGKSSLLIFSASAAKVLLFDLSNATPLVRIGSLVILGVTLYIGGWMYRKVDQMEEEDSSAPTH